MRDVAFRLRWLSATAAPALLGLVASPPTADAQRVFLYSEPTVCSTPFKPVSGITFHAGGQWRITWSTLPGQFGRAVFTGSPNPARSEDGMKLWEDPTAYVTCWIDWYQEGFGRQAYYDWRLEDYGGIVRNCSFDNPTQIAPGPDAGYDPYDTFDPEESGNCAIGSNGDGAGDNGGGDDGGCPMEYVYVEISYDGGATWVVLWEGWAEVCA